MGYFTVYPLGAEHAIIVRARTEAGARLKGALWFLGTSMRSNVDRPIKVVPLLRQPHLCECADDEELKQLENVITELVNAVQRS